MKFLLPLLLCGNLLLAQNNDKPFIKLVEPLKESNAVKTGRNFFNWQHLQNLQPYR